MVVSMRRGRNGSRSINRALKAAQLTAKILERGETGSRSLNALLEASGVLARLRRGQISVADIAAALSTIPSGQPGGGTPNLQPGAPLTVAGPLPRARWGSVYAAIIPLSGGSRPVTITGLPIGMAQTITGDSASFTGTPE